MSELLAALFLLAGVVAVPLSRRLTGGWFAPAALVTAVWGSTLGLFFLRLLPYPTPRATTVVFILAAVAALVGGSLAGERLATRTPGLMIPFGLPARPGAWVGSLAVLGLCGSAWYALDVGAILGWRAFDTPSVIRHALGDKTIPSEYLFLQYFCVATPLLAIALSQTGIKMGRWVYAGAIMCALATWITTDRTQFFLIVLGGFFVFAYRRGSRLSLGGLSAALLLCATLLVANFLLVGMWVGKTPAGLGVTMQLPGKGASAEPAPTRLDRSLQGASTLYLYSTASYAALDTLLRDPPAQTYGRYTFYPVLRLLQRLRIVDLHLPAAALEDRPLGLERGRQLTFNAYTFLYYPFVDFGVFGAVGYALVIGLVSGIAYRWVSTLPSSPGHLLLMAQIATALVLSVFVNKFNNTGSWYVGAATLLPFLASAARRGRTRA
jgi:hypothetical protein